MTEQIVIIFAGFVGAAFIGYVVGLCRGWQAGFEKAAKVGRERLEAAREVSRKEAAKNN